ncbi:glutamine amidotransferase [Rhizobium ruizarguesonis]|jgi:gamma-glutamyl-gamma-aminobutyrate hydrolase PuuD/enamine deaminase RidA (YjgF/YER057c/UK114 family)|uniref:Atu1372/SO_1960 family protein n=1 Tax=Rhizobium ruizarguesonis TaxID=2081791 RepID=UPI0010326B1D|nr:Atu1372/SO_1960 family protein [Rhizobium ruizarguesonis]QIJ41018.1 C26 family cysteine hydrolase domain-containing family [Rhizobium leguminosarum]NEH26332.1 glutamine amidotransferase [Rhizobium ruizarguesonis]NEJ05175.1 glutamine amidotransferase [Rhizobium ruizarguesonis]NEK06398.1 glutamine amidotransferase [Rhizobium ruizarguesonis]TAT84315.1 glutamine amidotransferase [Rhizobium ruizarguesonis]
MTTETTVATGNARRHATQSHEPRWPVILMTPDVSEAPDVPTETEYVVRANYADAIAEAGGFPLILPYNTRNLASALALADGIVLTGARPGTEVTGARRQFEIQLVEQALKTGKPLLGICHGMQLIGECLGGEFQTELPAAAVSHIPQDIPDVLAHEIIVEQGSVLTDWVGRGPARVNSLHRHALAGQGRFRVAARAPDGTIEAFEGDTDGFCLGIQWHPEYRLTELDKNIMRAFVDRSAEAAVRKARDASSAGSNRVRERLAQLELALPEASLPPGAFSGAVRTGNIITVSGQVPLKDGVVLRTGHLGACVSIEEGRECARWALLNALAQLEGAAGGFDNILGFVRLAGYVAADAAFERHGAVIDGASELLRELFPDRWAHARIAIGVTSLPRGVPVEVELTAVVGDEA